MAPTVLLEYTKEKTHLYQDHISFTMMGKSQKFSRGYSSGFVPDYRHAVDNMGESEGFGSSGRADSSDSCTPKRKCISLNVDKGTGFNIPLQVISLSKLTLMEKKDLEIKLRSHLEQIQLLQKKINSSVDGVAVSSSTNSQGKKRPAPVQIAPPVKRGVSGRFESTKQPKAAAAAAAAVPPAASNSNAILMKQCETLLKRLMEHQYGWVFNEPVDIVRLNIPDYFNIIKHPMDFGTIKGKLESGAYLSPWAFLSDVRLTLSNAMTYNPPGNDVHFMADTVRKFFEVRWKPIEKKLSAADSVITKEKVDAKPVQQPVQQSKKRKAPPANSTIAAPPVAEPMKKKKVSDEEKINISRTLESMLGDIPENIINFLKKHCDNGDQTADEEIEIDIDALGDDTLFELRKLIDEYLLSRKAAQQTKDEPVKMEILNSTNPNSSSFQPHKVNELVEEDVDIGGNDLPLTSYPPVEIEKDTVMRSSKYSSSNSSSSDSGSSSSDSDSASSSGSESDAGRPSTPTNVAKEVRPHAGLHHEKSDIVSPIDGSQFAGEREQQGQKTLKASLSDDCHQEGENAPTERQISPGKRYRAAILKSRFADTILKAREKTLDKADKGDPEKLRREREELERVQREERARLQAEAKAAEEARKQAEAIAAAETKRKIEQEREAARQALLKMEKTVEINENSQFLKDLEMLRGGVPIEQLPSSVDETSPDRSPDGMGGFKLGGSNPLEQLGLYIKADEEEEEEVDIMPASDPPGHDVEEGEIDGP